MRRTAIAASLALLLGASVVPGQVLTQIRDTGPRENRINLVILSEGYTSAELSAKFPADAVEKMTGFLNTEPYKEYAPYLNVFTLAVASAQSGSDHPSRGVFRDTYFNSSYDSFGQDRLVTIPPNDRDNNYNNGYGKVFALLAEFIPDYDQIVMIVNDTEYGGSGGTVAIASVNQSATEILIHEIGHSFADLADEYEIDAPQIVPSEKPNATRHTTRELIKWNPWILPETPVPTPETPPYGNVVGLFEGANYRPTGWYRPKQGCKMNALEFPFCEVCAEALVVTIYKRVALHDAASPDPDAGVLIAPEESKSFSVTPLEPAGHNLKAQWFLDGAAVEGATESTFDLSGAELAAGQHTLRVELRDETAFVRTDPGSDLAESITWTINPTQGPPALVLNISTRLRVQTGENALIGGFIIAGQTPKNVIIRAIGPSLGQSFSGALANPMLELFQGATLLESNADWKDTNQAAIEATTIPPSSDLESAIVRTLAPGSYTAIVRGENNTTGIGLVEAYDLDQAADSKLANISTRGLVDTGENVMIGGFIVGPAESANTKVVVRGIGPSLANFGITGVLEDPTLQLVNGNGDNIRGNDNWQDSQRAEIEALQLQPAAFREAALVETLAPGNYTAIVRGAGPGTGVGLVEIYNVQ